MAADRLQEHVCASCSKVYRRHDLLLRHRRRCRGLKERPTRQKACNACVQAKAKCSYSQPCTRCAGRGILCTYAYQPVGPDTQQSAPIDRESHQSTYQSSYQGIYLENNHHPAWLIGNDTGDLPAFELSWSLTSTPNFVDAGQPPDARHPTQGVIGNITTAHAAAEPVALLDPLLIPGLADLGSHEHDEIGIYSLRDAIQVLEQYPRNLLRDDFSTACLHRSLYDEDVPDMATLARTSMAVCCGSTMETAEGTRFARHAMDIERQRLIASYPTYSCMQQWDALHAMLVYSILELRASLADGNDSWKQKSCSQGLKAPFLVKMTRVFIQSHTLIPKEDLTSQSHMSTQTFQQWTVSETARRTIFLANIIHFLSSHDPETGQSSLYYEPLNDELILNMPLPCTHALWAARTEQEWRLTMEYCKTNLSPAMDNLSSTFHLMPGVLTLKNLLADFSHDSLRKLISSGLGLGSSDELRGLVILCALKQFGHTKRRPPS